MFVLPDLDFDLQRVNASPDIRSPSSMTANLDKKFPIEKEFSTTLLASAEYIGKPCDRVNREFLWCKMKNDNPEKCLSQGEDTLQCATDV